MDITTKIRKGIDNPRYAASHIIRRITSPPRHIFTNATISITSRIPFGMNIFDQEWDLLIILDSARYDIMDKLKSEYEFINCVEPIWSTGATSPEWMANTFTSKYQPEISQTGYITSNPHSATVLENNLSERYQGHRRDMTKLQRYGKYDIVESNQFQHYEPVWRHASKESEYDIYENYGNPRNVTDRAIYAARNNDFRRLILHYMPPHTPFIINAIRESRAPYEYEQSPWNYIKKSGDREPPFKACKDMFRWVLDDVELLLDNIDADDVVITADHGDGFGELGTYGHPAGSLNPYVRRVPWITTSATDHREYTPDKSAIEDKKEDKEILERRLSSLGYL